MRGRKKKNRLGRPSGTSEDFVDNPELAEFRDQKRAESETGEPLKKKMTPAQYKAAMEVRTAEKREQREKECREEARGLVDLVEGQLKPGVAALLLGSAKAEAFRTAADARERLVDPLTQLLIVTEFKPQSPAYWMSILLATWGFITWEQYQMASRMSPDPAARRGPEPVESQGRSWNPFGEKEKIGSSVS